MAPRWSQHDGKNGAVHVTLDVQQNPQRLEGGYGFKLVPVSGGRVERARTGCGRHPGHARRTGRDRAAARPVLTRVRSNNPDTLLIQWRATDQNFADDPITLEWERDPPPDRGTRSPPPGTIRWSKRPPSPPRPEATGEHRAVRVARTAGPTRARVPEGHGPRRRRERHGKGHARPDHRGPHQTAGANQRDRAPRRGAPVVRNQCECERECEERQKTRAHAASVFCLSSHCERIESSERFFR